jgi:hypothetical protein
MQIYYLINSYFLYKRFKVEYNRSKLRNGGVRDSVWGYHLSTKELPGGLILLRIDMFGEAYFLRNCIGGYSKRIQHLWAPSNSFCIIVEKVSFM